MKYLKTLYKSLKVTFSSRTLWILAAIVTIISIIGSSINVWIGEDSSQQIVMEQIRSMQNKPGMLLFFVGAFMILVILGVWLLTVSRNALVFCPGKITEKENISFKQGWEIGKNNFWKVLWLDIIIVTAGTLAFYLLSSPVVYLYESKAYLASFILGFFAFTIFMPFILIIFFVQTFGYREIILANKSLKNAMAGAYNLFIEKWKSSMVMFLVYILAVIYAVAVFAAVLFALSLPILFLLFILKYMSIVGSGDIVVILGIFFTPIFFFLLSLLSIYKEAVWTLFYQKIKE